MADSSTAQFVRLFAAHEAELYCYAFSLMANREDAKDVTQEAAVTMWQQFSEFDPSRPFRPWASRYIYFTALKLRKQSRASRYKISDEAVEALAEAVAAEAEASPTITQRRLKALGECIDKLPAQARRLMSQRYRQGQSIQEIARGTLSLAAYPPFQARPERVASPRRSRPAGALYDAAKACPCRATATRGEREDVMQPALAAGSTGPQAELISVCFPMFPGYHRDNPQRREMKRHRPWMMNVILLLPLCAAAIVASPAFTPWHAFYFVYSAAYPQPTSYVGKSIYGQPGKVLGAQPLVEVTIDFRGLQTRDDFLFGNVSVHGFPISSGLYSGPAFNRVYNSLHSWCPPKAAIMASGVLKVRLFRGKRR